MRKGGGKMENERQKEPEKKSEDLLLSELLENINQQLDLDTRIKELAASFIKGSSRRRRVGLIEEKANDIRNLYIEAESLQAEGRAIFHQLFGTEYE
jgi:hypothetical protein